MVPVPVALSLFVLMTVSAAMSLSFKLFGLAWQPVLFGAFGAACAIAVQKLRRRNTSLFSTIAFLAFVVIYPFMLGPVAVGIWDGWTSPYSNSVEHFFHPIMKLGARNENRHVYEKYMCWWLGIDSYSLWFWTNAELGRPTPQPEQVRR